MSKSRGENLEDLGRFISLVLRHHPETIGISIDEYGYANTQELIAKMNAHGKHIDFETLKYIVDTNNKKRYSFNEDFSKIRANQGHSIKVNLGLVEKIPPKVLYHGTATRFLDSIMREGITKQSRQYVHLSGNVETALSVGKRHGKPIVLGIDTTSMLDDGAKFYLSENGVWLCEYVNSKYVKVL
jgi:putative RNA 2'-phosphotransferase